LAAENDSQQSAKSIAGILELLWSERKLTDDREILSRSDQADVQVVEPEESTQELYLGKVRSTVEWDVAGAASTRHGESDLE